MTNKGKIHSSSASENKTRADKRSYSQHSAVHKPVPGKGGNGGKTGKGGSNN